MFSLKVCTLFRMTLDMPFSVVLFLGVVVLDILFGFGFPIGVGNDDYVVGGNDDSMGRSDDCAE